MKIQITILLACAGLLLAHTGFAQSGTIITLAGIDSFGYNGDNRPAITAKLYQPGSASFDRYGNIYVTDAGNCRIRKVNATTGIIMTIAGNGLCGNSGDGGPATSAKINVPEGIALDSSDNIYVSDPYKHKVRKIDAATGIITTFAGTGTAGSFGNGVPATDASFNFPHYLFIDKKNNLYIADYNNHLVRKIDIATGIITTIAGNSGTVSAPDGTSAISSGFNHIIGVCVDDTGNIYISEQHGYKVRKVSWATGLLTTIAGTGIGGFSGDSGPATNAKVDEPAGLCVDSAGNVYFADIMNVAVRRVDAITGIIETIAGTPGGGGSKADNIPATAAKMGPTDVKMDRSRNLIVIDPGTNRIRRICYDTMCLKIPTDTANHTNVVGIINATQHYQLTPNPSNGDIVLTQGEADNDAVAVDVRDIVGKSAYVSAVRFRDRSYHLNLQHLPSGLYFMRIRDSKERVYHVRFVVE